MSLASRSARHTLALLALTVACAAPASAATVHPSVARQIVQGRERLNLWIFFRDKGGAELDLDAALERARMSLSPRALDRRVRRSPAAAATTVGYRDIPVAAEYVAALGRAGATIRRRSRWLNAVSAEVPARTLEGIAELPFVAELRVLRTARWGEPEWQLSERARARSSTVHKIDLREAPRDGFGYDYGLSFDQLEQIDLIRLHEMGYSGAGILVAILDTGFRKSHEAFAGAQVVAERDFVFWDGETEDEGEDEPGAMGHGTAVWSLIGGWSPGIVIGGAFDAEFALAKTEDVRSETRVEEDNWVAAVEWADSLGADIITSSLGYFDFDGGFSYSYSDLDGRTAVTTLAAVVAQRLGIVVCSSMGNMGPFPGSLATPADADSILSVGAVYPNDFIAEFSSRGPTADARIKPDLCARGTDAVAAYWSAPDDYTVDFGGTSAAAPFVAAAAAVALEIHPEWTPADLIAAFRASASRAGSPDNDYGWGVLRAYDAAIPTAVGSPRDAPDRAARNRLQGVAPNPFNPRLRVAFELGAAGPARLAVYDAAGRLVRVLSEGPMGAGEQISAWDGRDGAGRSLASGVYTVVLETAGGREQQRALLLK